MREAETPRDIRFLSRNSRQQAESIVAYHASKPLLIDPTLTFSTHA